MVEMVENQHSAALFVSGLGPQALRERSHHASMATGGGPAQSRHRGGHGLRHKSI